MRETAPGAEADVDAVSREPSKVSSRGAVVTLLEADEVRLRLMHHDCDVAALEAELLPYQLLNGPCTIARREMHGPRGRACSSPSHGRRAEARRSTARTRSPCPAVCEGLPSPWEVAAAAELAAADTAAAGRLVEAVGRLSVAKKVEALCSFPRLQTATLKLGGCDL